MAPLLRGLLVCTLGMPLAALWASEAAVFPLVITALTAGVPARVGTRRIAGFAASHLVSGAAAFIVGVLMTSLAAAGIGHQPLLWLPGCIVLLGIQATMLRHPPALASGGAVLLGLPLPAVVACTVLTAILLALECRLARAG